MIGPTVEETKDFIIQAHGDQMRRGDTVPYYTHPIAVANIAKRIALELKVPENVIYDIERIALLHDVVEDTPVTIMMLGNMGYPISMLNSIHLLTREEDETHHQSVDAIIASGDIPAMIVKAADAYHNSLHGPEDVAWSIAHGRDPEKDHLRYIGSHNRLMETIVGRFLSGNWYMSDAEMQSNMDQMLAWDSELQDKLDANPELKALWEMQKSMLTMDVGSKPFSQRFTATDKEE